MRIDAAMERISGKVTVAAGYLSGVGGSVRFVVWSGVGLRTHLMDTKWGRIKRPQTRADICEGGLRNRDMSLPQSLMQKPAIRKANRHCCVGNARVGLLESACRKRDCTTSPGCVGYVLINPHIRPCKNRMKRPRNNRRAEIAGDRRVGAVLFRRLVRGSHWLRRFRASIPSGYQHR